MVFCGAQYVRDSLNAVYDWTGKVISWIDPVEKRERDRLSWWLHMSQATYLYLVPVLG